MFKVKIRTDLDVILFSDILESLNYHYGQTNF